MKRILLFVLLALLLACAPERPPQVVTVIQPYTAVIPLTTGGDTVLGQMRCDIGAGHSYIEIDTTLPPIRKAYVMMHEVTHTAQARGYGSCRAFLAKYDQDSTFRLQVEADAYCHVFLAQRATKRDPDPTYEEIVTMLRTRYRAEYTRVYVERHLPCY